MEAVGEFTLHVCVTRWNSGVFDQLTLHGSVLPQHPSARLLSSDPCGSNRGRFPPSPLFTYNLSNITYSRCGHSSKGSNKMQSGSSLTVCRIYACIFHTLVSCIYLRLFAPSGALGALVYLHSTIHSSTHYGFYCAKYRGPRAPFFILKTSKSKFQLIV